MADSKLEFKVGSISFSGEGDGDWLSKQLDKLLTRIPELIAVVQPDQHGNGSDHGGTPIAPAGTHGQASGALATYLKTVKADDSQSRKFLATAVWLHDIENRDRLTTGEVTKSLSDHKQGKLANASNCLADNAKRGFLVREGRKFYVSNEGRDSLK